VDFDWTDKDGNPALNLAGFFPKTDCLGPGSRCILWVQGCRKRCRDCITPEMQPLVERHVISVQRLSQAILAIDGICGITVVGGEPMLQAKALSRLFELVSADGHLGTMVYTGYSIEELKCLNHQDVERLLSLTDLLVDGEYRSVLDRGQKWRGSENQRFQFFTERYRSYDQVKTQSGRDLEVHMDESGEYLILGIPPRSSIFS